MRKAVLGMPVKVMIAIVLVLLFAIVGVALENKMGEKIADSALYSAFNHF